MGGNNGLEGVSYYPATNEIYTVKESSPKGYYAFVKPISYPVNLISGNTNVICNMNTSPFNLNDLAGIHHIGLTFNQSTNVLLLSEASNVLVQVNANCAELNHFSLNFMNQPEGITMDQNGNIYVVGEPNQLAILSTGTCVSNLTINVNTPFQYIYKSENSITTQGTVVIQSGQQVECNSRRVTLNQGFKVQAGANFKVRHGSCN